MCYMATSFDKQTGVGRNIKLSALKIKYLILSNIWNYFNKWALIDIKP
jgi:hypothetical protein